ncbi:MAG: TetR/AcrR family transcriptional regulator [Bacteriovoracaceae bacterium]|nr:TetR/AcrR family transcriptional regulator [Bacteriovoracaceae bacterium]
MVIEVPHYKREFVEQVVLSERQIAIIEAYLKLSEKIGVANVTLQKLAEEMGASLGSIHYHFGAKGRPSLLDSAIKHVSQESIKYINYHMDRALAENRFQGVSTYITILYDFCRTFPHHGKFWLYFYYLAIFDNRHREDNQSYLPLMRSRIEQVLVLGMGKGLYPPLKNMSDLSEKIHFQIVGALVISGGDESDQRFIRAQERALETCRVLIKDHEEAEQ